MPELPPPRVEFQAVRERPSNGEWTKDLLVKHVETSMQVELATLPIYLCALYSIHQDNGGVASMACTHIRTVVEQEMLHLALAGNMLCALDGKRPLYDKSFIPTYPNEILFDKTPMKLQPANKENLECFVKIEAPYMPPPQLASNLTLEYMEEILPDYRSIGEFYKSIELGIRELSAKDPGLFSKNRSKQLRGVDFFGSKMTVVHDETTALKALATMVDQGEGNNGGSGSHYTIFVELYQQHKQWQCVDYVKDPKTAGYKDKNKVAYHLSRAVDASYCFLLQTIDRCWADDVGNDPQGARREQLLHNVHRLMVQVLSPIARVLVQQHIGNLFAAPCFEFYSLDGCTPLPPKQLFEELKKEIGAAVEMAEKAKETESIEALRKVAFCLETFKEV